MELLSTSTFTPAGVVADAGAQLGMLDDTLWAARTPAELVGTVEELESLRSHLAAVEASVLAEIDARKVAKTHLSWSSTADWLAHLSGSHRGPARRAVRQAKQLTSDRSAVLDALREGAVSPEQAAVICDAVDQLPTKPELRNAAEALLLDEAGRLNATDLTKAARHLVHVIDPDRAERDAEKALDRADRAAHLGRFLAISEDGAGGVRVRGRGTVEDAALIKAALLPLTAPAPAVDPETCEEASDPRDHGARLWDALVETARHALTTELPPDSHGARPRLSVTTTLATLQGKIDWAALGSSGSSTDDGLELSPSTVRRLACDADVIPVVLGTSGEVLDVGRSHRLVTPALWRALVCRDQHCAFPGCSRPPVMSHGHHIQHWADGGPTSLDNLVLLCGQHHRVIHHTPWEVRLSVLDGRPEFRAPPRPGHSREWIRHRSRRE